jgi:hypothetical protein
MRVMNRVIRLALVVACLAMAMDVAAININVHEAQNKALQFLKNRSRTTLSAPAQQLRLAHAEKSKVDSRLTITISSTLRTAAPL